MPRASPAGWRCSPTLFYAALSAQVSVGRSIPAPAVVAAAAVAAVVVVAVAAAEAVVVAAAAAAVVEVDLVSAPMTVRIWVLAGFLNL